MRNPSNGFWRVTSPTDAQITLMREICRVLEKREPAMTRGSLSDFIAENIVEYRKRRGERK